MVSGTESRPSVLASMEKPQVNEDSSVKEGVSTVAIKEAPRLLNDCPPDGGLRAWLVVFGVNFTLVARRRRF